MCANLELYHLYIYTHTHTLVCIYIYMSSYLYKMKEVFSKSCEYRFLLYNCFNEDIYAGTYIFFPMEKYVLLLHRKTSLSFLYYLSFLAIFTYSFSFLLNKNKDLAGQCMIMTITIHSIFSTVYKTLLNVFKNTINFPLFLPFTCRRER